MLKTLFKREMPKRSDEEKLAIFLESPIIDDLLRKQNDKLLNDRKREAAEIARIDAELLQKGAELDKKITDATAAFNAATNSLAAAQSALRTAYYEKSALQNRSLAARNVLVNELKTSAPLVDDFLRELRDLYFANQNLQFKESLVLQRDNPFGGKTKTFSQSDPAIMGWYIKLDKTIRAAEELKLEPDFTTFPERIEKLRAGIENPADFSPVWVTVDTASGERIVEGAG